MQFLRRFSSHVKQCTAETNKLNTMVPGPFLRFLKTKKPKPESLETVYTKPARSLSEHDGTPSSAQLRTAQIVQKAIVSVQSLEPLPTALLTQIRIERVHVSRNLTRIRVFYKPEVDQKTKEIAQAFEKYQPLLNRLIHKYTHLKPSILYKFVRVGDTPLDGIYDQLEKEFLINSKKELK
ncbi:unnamed protein product [Rhizopus stolonifer]